MNPEDIITKAQILCGPCSCTTLNHGEKGNNRYLKKSCMQFQEIHHALLKISKDLKKKTTKKQQKN